MNSDTVTLAQIFGLGAGAEGRIRANVDLDIPKLNLPLTPDTVRNYIVSRALEKLRKALDTPVQNVLGAAWKKGWDLKALCKHPEGGDLPLLEHEFEWSRKPRIELVKDGKPTGIELQAEATLTFLVQGAILNIRNARLMSAHLGVLRAKGAVVVAGAKLAEPVNQKVMLPELISFGDGIELGKPSGAGAAA